MSETKLKCKICGRVDYDCPDCSIKTTISTQEALDVVHVELKEYADKIISNLKTALKWLKRLIHP